MAARPSDRQACAWIIGLFSPRGLKRPARSHRATLQGASPSLPLGRFWGVGGSYAVVTGRSTRKPAPCSRSSASPPSGRLYQ
jgi:hypothetical protein